MCGLPWKVAWESSRKLAGRLGWLLITCLRGLDPEVVALRSKMRELEKEIGTLQDAKVIIQEMITTQGERCHGLQGTVDQLVACIANKRRDRYGSKVLISQVCALTAKPSWDPKEWEEIIWSEFSDSEVEFELDLEGREVVEAHPPVQVKGQQEQTDGGVQVTHTYTLKDLREFLEIISKRVGKVYWHGFCKLGIVELHLSIY